jgi:2-methylcitrate dehydratase PrpD
MEAEFPANMSGTVTIRARGKSFAETVIVPSGEPANFLTERQLLEKFTALTRAVLLQDRAQRLAEAILSLDGARDLSGLWKLGLPSVA